MKKPPNRKFTPPSVTTGADGKRIEIYGWNKTCKYCHKPEMRWVGITDAHGNKTWVLEERDASTPSGVKNHKCPAYTASTASVSASSDEATTPVAPPTPAPVATSKENYGDW